MTKHENEIYRRGFFAGRNSVKSKLNYKLNYTEEELEEIRDYTIDCVDCAIRVYSEFFERSYKLSERLKKIPFLKNIYLKHKWRKKYYRIIIDFLSYMRSSGIPSYLNFLNSSVEISKDAKEKR